jgi:hypothetical protein
MYYYYLSIRKNLNLKVLSSSSPVCVLCTCHIPFLPLSLAAAYKKVPCFFFSFVLS